MERGNNLVDDPFLVSDVFFFGDSVVKTST